MPHFLPEYLLTMFKPREPLEYKPPVDELLVDRKRPPPTAVAPYVGLFEAPPPRSTLRDEPRVLRRQEVIEQYKRDKRELAAYKLEEAIKAWRRADPHPELTRDPYRTLFVGRLDHHTGRRELHREFQRFGKIKHCRLVVDPLTKKSRGYAFIEFSSEREASKAFKEASGIEIDGRRVVVDYELGRTRRNWLPRRLGGGKGGETRFPTPPPRSFAPPAAGPHHQHHYDSSRPPQRYPSGGRPPAPTTMAAVKREEASSAARWDERAQAPRHRHERTERADRSPLRQHPPRHFYRY